ncbi:hypothetical protein PsorP6_014529 [Peronosclerospora sorghi]|uniref:Uncharacterized protein n=1 Tax=Peronosclerospora sorghi TaxID=230839 RepID=A0ACC0VSD4_9STRA|nr:hypothetical protein PsorP6_014529 [Peronosclerospora sorghi]
MVDPPDLNGRQSWGDANKVNQAASLLDADEDEEMPRSSSFSYVAVRTPRNSAVVLDAIKKNILVTEEVPLAWNKADAQSHRDRFMSDAERLVAIDPLKTRDTYLNVDHQKDQWNWHDKPLPTILRHFNVDATRGLDTDEARKRLEVNGLNSLEEEKKAPLYVTFLLQFTNVIIGLLLVAAVASISLQEYVEGVAIIAIVTLNAVIATAQERSAGNALEALQKMTCPQCVVIRDGGRQMQILSNQLVTGDIVVLTTGDIVPADIRLTLSSDFKVNEMILTGESEDVLKKYDADLSRCEKLTADNMVFASTSVATGNATGVVVETGMSTRVGSIASLLKENGSGDRGKRPNCWHRFVDKYTPKMTPLQQSLHSLGVFMGTIVLGICVVVFIVGMVRNNADPKHPDRAVWLYVVMIAVSLAVSAVPEGLPMVVTICLSTGTADMVKKNVLVRKLAAVESLGASSVICTDKTGTLTEGKMTAVKLWSDSVTFNITGTGFNPYGDILCNGNSQIKAQSGFSPVSTMLLSSVLCSNTSLQQEKSDTGASLWVPMGNSSEAPLVVAAAKAGIWREEAMKTYPRLTEVPFSSTRKMMITVNGLPAGEQQPRLDKMRLPANTTMVANVKGAPNYVLECCTQVLRQNGTIATMHDLDRDHILKAVDTLSSQALRVLAVAIRPLEKMPFSSDEEDVDAKFEALCESLIFVGLVASIDPPRAGVKGAIQIARRASIRTVMITGDYLKTAVAIAREIDLLSPGMDAEAQAVDCSLLRPRQNLYLPDAELDDITRQVSVFARAKPEDKIEIVKSLQRQGHVAAMTGDGVNDAPALKEADIGVAMGIAGTAVAKGASDMILTDDNFCSIVSAVEKGREIYGNIQRFVCFLLSTNFGEITLIFVAIAVGMPNPLEPLQILVLNLFADGMAAVALSLEKGDGTVMSERPRPRSERIIFGRLWVLVLSNAFLIACGALIVFTCGLYWNFEKVLLDDITASIDEGEEAFRNVVCSRWMGLGHPRQVFTNCGARDLNGTYLFPQNIRSLNYYESDELLCYGGNYECVSTGTSRSQTMAFVYITTMEMLRAYTARSFTKSVFKDMFSNKWMQMAAIGSLALTLSVTNIPVISDDLFGFSHIEWYEWMFSMVFALVMVAFGEALKGVYRRRDRAKHRKAAGECYAGTVDEIQTSRHDIDHLENEWESELQQLRIRVETERPISPTLNHDHSTLTFSSSSDSKEEETMR